MAKNTIKLFLCIFDKYAKIHKNGEYLLDTLQEMFDEITDVRDSTGKRHCLSHILVMSVCGILNKQIDFEDIHDYALAHEEYFNKKLEL